MLIGKLASLLIFNLAFLSVSFADYLKLDNCRSCPNESYATALKHYAAMGTALNKTGSN